jgi:hypothetical protein
LIALKKLTQFCPISALASAESDTERSPSTEDLSNLSDYYDPEDLTGTGSSSLGSSVLTVEDRRKLQQFRATGCRKGSKLFTEIPVFNSAQRKLARFFISLGTVYSVGSSENIGNALVVFKTGLPDGLFSNQKSQFG